MTAPLATRPIQTTDTPRRASAQAPGRSATQQHLRELSFIQPAPANGQKPPLDAHAFDSESGFGVAPLLLHCAPPMARPHTAQQDVLQDQNGTLSHLLSFFPIRDLAAAAGTSRQLHDAIDAGPRLRTQRTRHEAICLLESARAVPPNMRALEATLNHAGARRARFLTTMRKPWMLPVHVLTFAIPLCVGLRYHATQHAETIRALESSRAGARRRERPEGCADAMRVLMDIAGPPLARHHEALRLCERLSSESSFVFTRRDRAVLIRAGISTEDTGRLHAASERAGFWLDVIEAQLLDEALDIVMRVGTPAAFPGFERHK